jgi:hypothetical protein
MIYSAAFRALPDEARRDVYRRMWTILSGADDAARDARHARLSAADRVAVLDILRETVSDWPGAF